MDSKILERLAKLMEMAERGTEHEAQVASQRAAELMAKYQLTTADVQGRDQGAKVTVEEGRVDGEADAMPSRIENWNKQLFGAVVEVMGGKAWFSGKGKYAIFHMIGPKDSVATARYLYMQLERDVNRLSRKAQREHVESNAWRRAYACGMVTRLYERLKAGRADAMREATSTALVWVDKTKQAIDEAYDAKGLGKGRRGPMKRPDAKYYGYRDGDGVDLGGSNGARLGEGQKRLK